MATATALFGVPATILEGPGIDPWEAAFPDVAPSASVTAGGPEDPETPGALTDLQETPGGVGGESPEGTPGVDLAAFHALSAAALRDLAKAVGAPTKGNKAALVERITTSPLPLGMAELPAPFAHLTPWFTAAE
jgi:hypothetical protein